MKRLATFFCIVLSITAFAEEFDFQRINPPTLNKHPAYSQVTTVSGDMKLIFVAGQVDRAIDYKLGSNECRHDDFRNQYIGMMDNIKLALESAGASLDDVVFIRTFTTSMKDFLSMYADLAKEQLYYWKQGEAPPSTLIEVVQLSEPCQLMEADVTAVIKTNK